MAMKTAGLKFPLALAGLSIMTLIFVIALKTVRAAEPSSQNSAATNEVRIDNFTFMAPTITVPAGTEVTWVNRDDIPHTVVSDDKVFKSKALDTDDRFTYKFSQPGTYKYFCSLHPKMTGEVVVK
jgi:plastocyanin